jgi:hypothetical protein
MIFSDEEGVAGSGSEEDNKSEGSDAGDEEENDDDDDDDDADEGSESNSGKDSDSSDEDDRESDSGSDDISEPGGKTQDMLISWGDGDSEDDEDYIPPDQRSDSKPPIPAGKVEAVPHRKEDIKVNIHMLSVLWGKFTSFYW